MQRDSSWLDAQRQPRPPASPRAHSLTPSSVGPHPQARRCWRRRWRRRRACRSCASPPPQSSPSGAARARNRCGPEGGAAWQWRGPCSACLRSGNGSLGAQQSAPDRSITHAPPPLLASHRPPGLQVRAVFEAAAAMAPAVVFIDEIDALAPTRWVVEGAASPAWPHPASSGGPRCARTGTGAFSTETAALDLLSCLLSRPRCPPPQLRGGRPGRAPRADRAAAADERRSGAAGPAGVGAGRHQPPARPGPGAAAAVGWAWGWGWGWGWGGAVHAVVCTGVMVDAGLGGWLRHVAAGPGPFISGCAHIWLRGSPGGFLWLHSLGRQAARGGWGGRMRGSPAGSARVCCPRHLLLPAHPHASGSTARWRCRRPTPRRAPPSSLPPWRALSWQARVSGAGCCRGCWCGGGGSGGGAAASRCSRTAAQIAAPGTTQ